MPVILFNIGDHDVTNNPHFMGMRFVGVGFALSHYLGVFQISHVDDGGAVGGLQINRQQLLIR